METIENQIESHEGKWGAMLAISLGVFMGSLDMSIINISLPTLLEQLDTKFATIQWVVIGYNLVITSTMLGAARMGDLYGKKKLYGWGLFIFTVASLLCGFSPSVGWLIAFRILQGFGAVMMYALGSAIIVEAFPPQERGRALGIVGSIASVGISLGPAIGGVISVALSLGSPRVGVTDFPPLWSPDFPPANGACSPAILRPPPTN